MRLRRLAILGLIVGSACARSLPPPPGPAPAPAPAIGATDPVPEWEKGLNATESAVRADSAGKLWDSDSPEARACIERTFTQGDPAALQALLEATRARRALNPPAGLVTLLQRGDPAQIPLLLESIPSFDAGPLCERLDALLRDIPLTLEAKRRIVATLGATRLPKAVHILITRLATARPALLTRPGEIDPLDAETFAALERLTGWRGNSTDEWIRWWERHATRSREEWLEEALHLQRASAPPDESGALKREVLALKNDQFALRLDRLLEQKNPAALRALLGAALLDPFPEHRAAALAHCGRIDPALAGECLPAIANATRDPDLHVRIAAVTELGHLGTAAIAPSLTTALRDPEAAVRAAAAEALGRVNAPGGAEALIERLGDPDERVVAAAVEILGKLRAPEAIARLLPLTETRTDTVRRAAIFALGEFADPRAVPSLTAALRHSDTQTRWCAATALGKIDDPAARPKLREALGDSSPAVRLAALDALARPDHADSVALCTEMYRTDTDEAVRLRALERLALRTEPAAIDALMGATRGENPRLSAAAHAALGQTAEHSVANAVALLERLLTAHEPLLAQEILSRIPERPPVEEGAVDPLIVWKLRTGLALAEVGDWKSALPWLQGARGGSTEDPAVRPALLRGYRALADFERALALAEESLAQAPTGSASAWTWRIERIRSLCDLRRFAAARKELAAVAEAGTPPDPLRDALTSLCAWSEEGLREENTRIAALQPAFEKAVAEIQRLSVEEQRRLADRLRERYGLDAIPLCANLLDPSTPSGRAEPLCALLRRWTPLPAPWPEGDAPSDPLREARRQSIEQIRAWFEDHRP